MPPGENRDFQTVAAPFNPQILHQHSGATSNHDMAVRIGWVIPEVLLIENRGRAASQGPDGREGISGKAREMLLAGVYDDVHRDSERSAP